MAKEFVPHRCRRDGGSSIQERLIGLAIEFVPRRCRRDGGSSIQERLIALAKEFVHLYWIDLVFFFCLFFVQAKWNNIVPFVV